MNGSQSTRSWLKHDVSRGCLRQGALAGNVAVMEVDPAGEDLLEHLLRWEEGDAQVVGALALPEPRAVDRTEASLLQKGHAILEIIGLGLQLLGGRGYINAARPVGAIAPVRRPRVAPLASSEVELID